MTLDVPDKDCISGCLLGGALGDAIGSYYEGAAPSGLLSVPADLRLTDDTQLTIATCEAIIASEGVDPEAIAARFLYWFRRGRISGIGASTLKAMTELDVGGHWAYTGALGEYSAGNGAAMRIAPLAFMLDPDDDIERRTIRDVCQITHRNDEAYLGALALVRGIRHVALGNPLDRNLLSLLIAALPDSRVRDRLTEVDRAGLTVTEYSRQFASGGYVVDSVPLAILAAIESADFISAIAAIVSVGGDTDTIGSMCGQLLGAAHGVDFVPSDLVDRIDDVSLLRQTTSEFIQVTQTAG